MRHEKFFHNEKNYVTRDEIQVSCNTELVEYYWLKKIDDNIVKNYT